MKKQKLISFINKYNILGVDSVWKPTNDNSTTVATISKDSHLLIHVTAKNFNLNKEIGVENSSNLLKKLSLFKDDDIDISLVENTDGMPRSLVLQNKSIKDTTPLMNTVAIKQAPSIKSVPEPDLTYKLDEKFRNNFIPLISTYESFKMSLVDIVNDNGEISFNMGEKSINTNTVKVLEFNGKLLNPNFTHFKFMGNYLKDILNVNSELDGVLNISDKGLMTATFNTEDFTSVYYLVAIKAK